MPVKTHTFDMIMQEEKQKEDRGLDRRMWADVLYRQIKKHFRDTRTEQPPLEATYRLFEKVFVDWTDRSGLHFHTLFARMAYLFSSEQISSVWVIRAHRFRKRVTALLRRNQPEKDQWKWWTQYGLLITAHLVREMSELPLPESLSTEEFDWKDEEDRSEQFKEFIRRERVWAVRIEPDEQTLYVLPEGRPEQEVRVVYDHEKINDLYSSQVESLARGDMFPITMYLHSIVCTEAGIWYPSAIVIEPDFLIDVTAVAECFSARSVQPVNYLIHKFIPVKTNKYLLAGQAANVFLDALISNPDREFKPLFSRLFQMNPLGFASVDDAELMEIMDKCKIHFSSLRQVVHNRFQQMGIEPSKAYIEPSFSAPAFGIQGRLDVLHADPGVKNRTDIIELKSGKTYFPNKYRINQNHYVQTLLYDLLIEDTRLSDSERKAFVLYSIEEEDPLRYAPAARALQWEAIAVRNQLLLFEKALGAGISSTNSLLRSLRVKRYPKLKGFRRSDLSRFESVYQQLSETERTYFDAFVHFIAREHFVAKVGFHGRERRGGSADLWLNDLPDKEDQFDILKKMKLSENRSMESDPGLTFERTEFTNALANFREGDIAVLYPHIERARPTDQQIFKCTITGLDSDYVEVRLRSAQRNQQLFEQYTYWNLEHDVLDSSFHSLYESLFSFAESPEHRRQLILTERPPAHPEEQYEPGAEGMTREQGEILKRMVNAREYFLLWGPPGTGKTRIILSRAASFLFRETDERILLIAYTNKAVDEMCDALIALDDSFENELVRIGSRFGTAEHLRPYLLREQTRDVSSRKELKELLHSRRIYLGTVSSMLGATDLWELVDFDRMFVDEASQVLEPALSGLLHRVPTFVLIGDHRQLPAVVTQSREDTIVREDSLRRIGLTDLRNALFERMYTRAMEEGWDWAYGQLSHQGRMHRKVMEFPSREFYGDLLDVLPDEIPDAVRQQQPLWAGLEFREGPGWMYRERSIYIPTSVDLSSAGLKSNRFEARMVRWLIEHLEAAFNRSEGALKPEHIGVITPYRAQIARIRESLSERGEWLDKISVDTVERYQGSSRDIIILSLCTNEVYQFKTMAQVDDDGLDRRLNVALTRAREQVIVLGNREILRELPQYRRFVEFAYTPKKDQLPEWEGDES